MDILRDIFSEGENRDGRPGGIGHTACCCGVRSRTSGPPDGNLADFPLLGGGPSRYCFWAVPERERGEEWRSHAHSLVAEGGKEEEGSEGGRGVDTRICEKQMGVVYRFIRPERMGLHDFAYKAVKPETVALLAATTQPKPLLRRYRWLHQYPRKESTDEELLYGARALCAGVEEGGGHGCEKMRVV